MNLIKESTKHFCPICTRVCGGVCVGGEGRRGEGGGKEGGRGKKGGGRGGEEGRRERGRNTIKLLDSS